MASDGVHLSPEKKEFSNFESKGEIGDGVGVEVLFQTYFDCLVEKTGAGLPPQLADFELLQIFALCVASWHCYRNPKPKEFAQNLPLVNSSTEKITLRNLRLQSLPHDIFLVTNLVELDLESNDFEVLSEGISYLSNLESLNLRKNRLPHLPAALGQLTTLKTLSLSHNRLKHFPAVLCRLRNLLVLHLDHNLIQKVPSSLFWFPELKELHLNNNQLTCVPESIGWSPNIQRLYLHDNCLESIPRNLSQLPLVGLTLHNNPLQPPHNTLLSLSSRPLLNAISKMPPNQDIQLPQPYRLYRANSNQQQTEVSFLRPIRLGVQLIQAACAGDLSAIRKQKLKGPLPIHSPIQSISTISGVMTGDTVARWIFRQKDPKLFRYFYGDLSSFSPDLWSDVFHHLMEETDTYFFKSDFHLMTYFVKDTISQLQDEAIVQQDQDKQEISSLTQLSIDLLHSLYSYLRSPNLIPYLTLPDEYKLTLKYPVAATLKCSCCYHLAEKTNLAFIPSFSDSRASLRQSPNPLSYDSSDRLKGLGFSLDRSQITEPEPKNEKAGKWISQKLASLLRRGSTPLPVMDQDEIIVSTRMPSAAKAENLCLDVETISPPFSLYTVIHARHEDKGAPDSPHTSVSSPTSPPSTSPNSSISFPPVVVSSPDKSPKFGLDLCRSSSPSSKKSIVSPGAKNRHSVDKDTFRAPLERNSGKRSLTGGVPSPPSSHSEFSLLGKPKSLTNPRAPRSPNYSIRPKVISTSPQIGFLTSPKKGRNRKKSPPKARLTKQSSLTDLKKDKSKKAKGKKKNRIPGQRESFFVVSENTLIEDESHPEERTAKKTKRTKSPKADQHKILSRFTNRPSSPSSPVFSLYGTSPPSPTMSPPGSPPSGNDCSMKILSDILNMIQFTPKSVSKTPHSEAFFRFCAVCFQSLSVAFPFEELPQPFSSRYLSVVSRSSPTTSSSPTKRIRIKITQDSAQMYKALFAKRFSLITPALSIFSESSDPALRSEIQDAIDEFCVAGDVTQATMMAMYSQHRGLQSSPNLFASLSECLEQKPKTSFGGTVVEPPLARKRNPPIKTEEDINYRAVPAGSFSNHVMRAYGLDDSGRPLKDSNSRTVPRSTVSCHALSSLAGGKKEGFISANNSGTYKFGSTPTEKPGEIMASGLESSFQIDSKNLISCEIGAARKESRNEIEVPQKKPTVSEYNQTSRANSSGAQDKRKLDVKYEAIPASSVSEEVLLAYGFDNGETVLPQSDAPLLGRDSFSGEKFVSELENQNKSDTPVDSFDSFGFFASIESDGSVDEISDDSETTGPYDDDGESTDDSSGSTDCTAEDKIVKSVIPQVQRHRVMHKTGSRIGIGGEDFDIKRKSLNAPHEPNEPPDPDDRQVNRGWNDLFQEIVDHLEAPPNPSTSFGYSSLCFQDEKQKEDVLSASGRLVALSRDFVHTAETYGRIIILERFSPVKTLQAAKVGGAAGGQKYIVNNVMFKFAADSQGIFAFDDLAAAKVASHDLKGLMAYMSCGLSGLRVPLMALVDYLGFRLTAMSLLPVGSDTLVYGTMDAGKNFKSSNEKVNQLMEETSKILNLCPHLCGRDEKEQVTLFSAADIEGHIGRDGRTYLIDFSRTFPPTTPDRNVRMGHLFQLFRREFVLKYSNQLCPDAFSGFIRYDPQNKEYNREIERATDELTTRVIPEMVLDLENQLSDETDLEKFSLSHHMHKHGVNMRFIGIALQRPTITRTVYILMLMEAIARVLKNELNRRFRDKAAEVKGCLTIAPLRGEVVEFFNLVFGLGKKELDSPNFWFDYVLPALRLSFSMVCEDREDLRGVLLKKISGSGGFPARYLLFRRLQEMTGLEFEASVGAKMKTLRCDFTIDPLHLISFGLRVKHTTTVINAEGNFIHTQALHDLAEAEVDDCLDHLLKARSKFEKSLEDSPHNLLALRQLIRVNWRILEIKIDKQNNSNPEKSSLGILQRLSCVSFSVNEALEMGGFFQRVMEKEDINEDGEVDFQCAAFLLQGGQAQRSHNILCSLCEKFPKKVDYLLALGLLLLTQSVSQGNQLLAKGRFILRLVKILNNAQKNSNFTASLEEPKRKERKINK